MSNQRAQGGFTLIELVIVIVILGILAAVAVPKYVDLTDEAQTAACEGLRGAVLGTSAILLASDEDSKAIGAPATPVQIVAATTVSSNIAKPDPDPTTCTLAYKVNSEDCPVAVPTDLCKP